jgi:hypothetical protein
MISDLIKKEQKANRIKKGKIMQILIMEVQTQKVMTEQITKVINLL